MGKENMQNKKPMILVLAGPNGSGNRCLSIMIAIINFQRRHAALKFVYR